jgi:hypothetical protein
MSVEVNGQTLFVDPSWNGKSKEDEPELFFDIHYAVFSSFLTTLFAVAFAPISVAFFLSIHSSFQALVFFI